MKNPDAKTGRPVFCAAIPPELLTQCRVIEAELKTTTDEITRLTEKINKITAARPGLEMAVNQTARIKSDVLAAHAVDRAPVEDLEAARNNHDLAVKADTEAKELFAAVEKALKQAQARIHPLQAQNTKARHNVWKEFQNQVIAEIRAVAGELYIQADVAAKMTGAMGLNNPFEGGAHPSQLKELSIPIAAKIFG